MDIPNACPKCSETQVYFDGTLLVCPDCAHEWSADAPARAADAPDEGRVVRDVDGKPLAPGDSVTLIKNLKLKGGSVTLKQGTKISKIRIVDGDHEVDCRVDNMNVLLKAEFLRKA